MRCLVSRVATLALLLSSLAFCQEGFVHLLFKSPVTVNGIVLDSKGRPIPSVAIDYIAKETELGISEDSVRTDATGRFHFQTLAPAVVLRKNKFKSQLLRIVDGMGDATVVMETAALPEETPECKSDTKCLSLRWGIFCMPRLKGVEAGAAGGSVDAIERTFATNTASGRSEMIHGTGPSWGGPYSRSREVWGSEQFEEHTRKLQNVVLVDARGAASNGKLWRSVGVSGESVSYFDLEPDAAVVFDRLLDGMCLRTSHR